MLNYLPGHTPPSGLWVEPVKERVWVVGKGDQGRGFIEQRRQALVVMQVECGSISPLVVVLFLDVGWVNVEEGTRALVGAQDVRKVSTVNQHVAQAPLQGFKQVKGRVIGNRLQTSRTGKPAMMDRANKGIEGTSEHIEPADRTFERVKYLSMIEVVVILGVQGSTVG